MAVNIEAVKAMGRQVEVPSGQDAYEVLGMNPYPTLSEINRAYHHKARSLHPDKGGSQAGMDLIKIAKPVLSPIRWKNGA